ncbi:hypothetical protein JOM56_007065, partial [Amanita muscaria]
YKIPGADIPVVHRLLETHDVPTSARGRGQKTNSSLPDQLLLTKVDNNLAVDDIELYQGLEWLERKHLIGKTHFNRHVENDFPQLKYALLGSLCLLALL